MMDIAGIETALQTYFQVMHECDMQLFDQVFHPSCSLFTMKDGAMTVRPYAMYREEMSRRTPPRSLGQPRDDEAILKIEMLSPEIALAQVRVRIFEKIFVDNLKLLKVRDRWMVVAKIYHHAASAA